MAGLDGEQCGDRAEQPRQLVRRAEQRARAVLALQAHRQRFDARFLRRDLAFGGALGLDQLLDARLGRVVGLDRVVVPLHQVGVVGLLDPALGPRQFELFDGDLSTFGGLFEGDGEPVDLVRGGAVLAAQRLDLAGQLGQALATVGDRADRGPVRAFRGLDALFEVLAAQDRLGQQLAGLHDGLVELLFLLGDALGLFEKFLGVAAAGVRDDVGGEVALPFDGEPDGAAQPLGQRGELVPGLLGRLQQRRILGERCLQLGLFRGDDLELLFDFGAALAGKALVGLLLGDRLALSDQVVGEQPQAGVAQLGLDGLSAASDLGLLAQRLELAAQLGGQVAEAVQVALHVGELAKGLFLALAVLEHARGLFDEGAALLGLGLEDRGQLALADDDVHLTADAGVRQQLLDVQQPAAVAVDLVLAGAVAEHPPGDGDLGILDRERAVGVVDGEGDLGPAERGTARGPGEDDVLHLAAAQVLRTLGAHDPAKRVQDVRLARAVRADHAGDTGFETQRGGRGEGLEALERQAFQVHVGLTP